MMKIISIFSIILLLLINFITSSYGIEQVHISLGTDETEMIVTWTDPDAKKHSDNKGKVYYHMKEHDQQHVSDAIVEHFHDDDVRYDTYRALLTNLEPNKTYVYWIVMNDDKKSDQFKFRTLQTGEKWLPRFGIYGDLGYVNERSLPFLKKDVADDMFDVIFHIGDFAYDLNDEKGKRGHKFMKTIEPVASKVPYMVCPGNHESHHNFSHYDSRFSMLDDRHNPKHDEPLNHRINNHFHSMDIGPAHIILFSTEYYYYTKYGWDQIIRQYDWLEQDLKRANHNRDVRPWIIVMGHRPLYCVKLGDSSCDHLTLERKDIREGIHMHGNSDRKYGLENLFFKYGVDIQFYGHEHFYARMLPIYNYTNKSGKQSNNPYNHPNGPVHITTGSAGNQENHPPFNMLPNWVAHHFLDYGYTRLFFKDQFHIQLQQVSDDQNGKVLDEIDIIKSTSYPHWMPESLENLENFPEIKYNRID